MNQPETEPLPLPEPSKRRALSALIVLSLWLWAVCVLLAGWGPWVELASHFVWQALLLSVAILTVCAWKGRWLSFAWSLPPTLYFLCLFQPWALWQARPPAADGYQHALQVMSWNVLCVNEQLEEIERVVVHHPVDLLILIEVRPNLLEQIPAIRQQYKHCLSYPSWSGNGIAVLTNRDDIVLSRVDFAGLFMPSIQAVVGQQQLKVVAVHTWSPMPPSRSLPRDQQLAELKEWTQQQELPVCVLGDLNITPWAPAFTRMIDAGFVDWRTKGFGNLASWPCWLGPLGIPIDHALSYGKCAIANRRQGPMVWGSDHRPILAEIKY